MAKKSFKELQEIDSLVANLYKQQPGLENTKFGYAYKRFSEKFYFPKVKEMSNEVMNARIDNSLEDPTTKEVLSDPNPRGRGFKFSREGLKKVIELENQITEKWENKEIEVEPHISSYVPEVLTEEQAEMLKGILL